MWTHDLWASSLLAIFTHFNLCPFWSSSISFVCSFVCSSSRSTAAGFLSLPYRCVFTNTALLWVMLSRRLSAAERKTAGLSSKAGSNDGYPVKKEFRAGVSALHLSAVYCYSCTSHGGKVASWHSAVHSGVLTATLILATALGINSLTFSH